MNRKPLIWTLGAAAIAALLAACAAQLTQDGAVRRAAIQSGSGS